MSDSQPRVVIVVTAGVTARLFISGYAEHLVRDGFSVTIIADDLSDVRYSLSQNGVESRSLAMRREPSPIADMISLWRMIVLLRELSPDVIVYATPKASLLAGVAAKILRIRVRIYNLWGLRFETATGIKREVLKRLERLTAATATSVLANSRSLAAQAVESRVSKPNQIDVLGNGSSHGVDIHEFSPNAETSRLDERTYSFVRRGSGLIVGFVGRLHPDKGLDTLISAIARMTRAGIAVRLLIVGEQEGAVIDPNLLAQIEHRVQFVGAVIDVRPYLRAIDVLVLMSKREGFPNVVLEAAAMGTPALVADSTGTIDSVEDGVTGYVLPAGDAVRLAEVLTALDSDRSAISRLGQAARLRTESLYAQETVWSLHSSYLREEIRRSEA